MVIEKRAELSTNLKVHGPLSVPEDILLIESQHPKLSWNLEGKMPENYDWSGDYDLKKASVSRWLGYLQSGKINEAMMFQELLPLLGVEQDNSGKIVLYHATNFDNLVKILNDKCLRPASETGSRTWRIEGEDELSKINKIYLFINHNIFYIASSVSKGAYILKVHTNPKNLKIDEDSYKKEGPYKWLYSIACGMTCAHLGSIDQFEIIARINKNTLDPDADIEYILRDVPNSENKNILRVDFQKYKFAFYDIEKQKKYLQEIGINFENIPAYEKVVEDFHYVYRQIKN